NSDFEVLARGPLHEAFAQPSTLDPKASPIIPKQPPRAIEEEPPAQRPEGNNVQWIAGYWAWDDDNNDFIWISGLCPDLPPRRPSGSGCPARGLAWLTAGSGSRASGPRRAKASSIFCRHRRLPWRMALRWPRRVTIIRTSLACGSGVTASYGGLATGCGAIRTG